MVPQLIHHSVFPHLFSTVAAGVNALAAITFIDAVQPLYKKFGKKPMTSRNTTIITKLLGVLKTR